LAGYWDSCVSATLRSFWLCFKIISIYAYYYFYFYNNRFYYYNFSQKREQALLLFIKNHYKKLLVGLPLIILALFIVLIKNYSKHNCHLSIFKRN